MPSLLHGLVSTAKRLWQSTIVRVVFGLLVLVLLLSEIIPLVQPRLTAHAYAMGNASALLTDTSPDLAKKITHDPRQGTYTFNAGFTAATDTANPLGPRITATLHDDPAKGIDVTDPVTGAHVGLKPSFGLRTAKQDANRIMYPLTADNGWLVYTMQGAQVKEDIVLTGAHGDTFTARYNVVLDDGLEAHMHADGSLAIYGSSLPINGTVTTGSDADKRLLDKARQKAAKDRLLFTIPAPTIIESGAKSSAVSARYVLKGDVVTLTVHGLRAAHFPLTIDPSVYVESAAKFMQGNNESNIDFDTSNELIQKGALTGARITGWTGTTSLNTALWKQGTAVGGGYVYSVGGSTTAANTSSIYWSKFNTATKAITSPNPGDGTCTNWCTKSAYNLPAPRSALSAVVYNGYMYAVGGEDAGCTTGAGTGNTGICNTVYYAKLGANGEPISWASTTQLTTERSYAAVATYNNRMYLLGGKTATAGGGVTTVEYADINPNGALSAWTATTALPSARHNHSAQIYNGYLYVIGGNSSGTLQNGVSFAKITSTGALASSWVSTTAFTTPRMGWGGTFSTIWGGYLYVAGGCTAINASGYCTTVANDLQLASLNADGTVTDWTTITGITQSVLGYGFVAWRNTLYAIGGCTAQNTTTGACTTTTAAATYGRINSDGDVSPTQTETSLPTAGTGAGQVGRMSQGVILNNGYLYNIGGCANVGCTTMSPNTAYAPVNSDGSLGSWTVDSTNTLNGTTGLGAFGFTVFNNTIYVFGGATGAAFGSTVYRVGLNANGSLAGAWASQAAGTASTQTGISTTARGYSVMFTRANPASAGTNPANLYILTGCSGTTGVGCSTYFPDVYKCSITTTGALATVASGSQCTTTGQLQIDADTGTSGIQGLGLTAGALYGNYIYMAGGANGSGDTHAQLGTVFFAKIDASNNIVRADNGSATGNWQIASNTMPRVRRRSTAFAVNGYLYVVAGHDGTTGSVATLNDIVYAKIDQTTGDLGAFTTLGTSITARWNLGAGSANGYSYLVGGCTTGDPPSSCTAMSGVVQSVQVYNNYSGSPKQYNAPSNLFTTDRFGAGVAAYNGYLYVAGGCTSTADCSAYVGDTQYAPINSDGTLGTWATGPNFPTSATRAFGCMVAQGGYLYYLGGRDSTTAAYGTVYYSQLSGGVPGAWTAASKGIGDAGSGAQARIDAGCTVFNNRIYVTGGANATPTYQSTVFVSPSLPAGGDISANWTSTTAFSTARSGAVAVAYGGTLYILGGFDGTNYLLDSQYASIDSSGAAGSWTAGTTLPQPVRQGAGFAANGYLYVFGGRSAATTCTNNTYVAPISGYPPGSTNRYGIGSWSQTNITYSGTRYAVGAAYVNGRAYLVGGQCNSTLTGANRVVYSTLQAQPQVATYSLAIDTDTDVFPSKWLMNGVDNGTGAQWTFSYRSSTNAAAQWGQTTNYGTVTLGTPGSYTPVDGSGTTTNFARYYYLFVTVDSSQAFGYPEDTTRGPTIADLTLQFTSDPAKRLLHGTTFTGGIKQPLDTPF